MYKILFFSLSILFGLMSKKINKPFNQKNLIKIDLIDSIQAINYYDFYQKEINEIFLTYPILNKYKYIKVSRIEHECINALELTFEANHRFISIKIYPRKNLKYQTECLDYPKTWDIDLLKKEKVRKIEVIIYNLKSITKKHVGDKICDSLSRVSNIDYQNRTLGELINKTVLEKHVFIEPILDDKEKLLGVVLLFFKAENEYCNVKVFLQKPYKYTKKKIQVRKEDWNLNLLKKEKIKYIEY